MRVNCAVDRISGAFERSVDLDARLDGNLFRGRPARRANPVDFLGAPAEGSSDRQIFMLGTFVDAVNPPPP
jgi:hypothetical protein